MYLLLEILIEIKTSFKLTCCFNILGANMISIVIINHKTQKLVISIIHQMENE